MSVELMSIRILIEGNLSLFQEILIECFCMRFNNLIWRRLVGLNFMNAIGIKTPES